MYFQSFILFFCRSEDRCPSPTSDPSSSSPAPSTMTPPAAARPRQLMRRESARIQNFIRKNLRRGGREGADAEADMEQTANGDQSRKISSTSAPGTAGIGGGRKKKLRSHSFHCGASEATYYRLEIS